ncbi:MAG: DUF5832 domain-containing protein [Candidatus Hodarchaeales archaeon]
MTDTQSSLTSPGDKVDTGFKSRSKPALNDEETERAYKECFVSSLVDIAYDRKYADPKIPGQTYSLHSFIPAKGAKPDKDGIFGMLKIRGTFGTLEETNDKAEDLIRNHDSYHKIFHGWVGKPMPITIKSDFSAEVEEVDINQQISKIVREDVKDKRAQEKKQVQQIRERERNLKEAVEQEASDPYEKYTCLRVKKAQVVWSFMEHRKKLTEMLDVFDQTLLEIKEMDDEDEDYARRYLDRYLEAREKAGIPMDKNDSSFMKYLNVDVIDLEDYAKEQEALEDVDDPNYKVSRLAGSTVTVERRPQPGDDDGETKKLETVVEEEPAVEDAEEDAEKAVKDVPVEGPTDDKPKSD